MKKIILFSLTMTAVLFTLELAAQFIPTALRNDNVVVQSLTDSVEQAGWLYIKEEANLQPYELFSTYKGDMGLASGDVMTLIKDETDELGIEHKRYQQYHNGVRVEWAEYTEHIRDCKVIIAHGKLLENITETTTPTITESHALTIATSHIGANTYSWENSDTTSVNDYEEDDDPYWNTTPNGELLLGYINQDGVIPENYELAWRFEVISIDPGASNEIYIDAETGTVLKMASLECTNGPASLLYSYGTRTIDTKFKKKFLGQDYYFLRAKDDTRNIHTRKGTFADWASWWRRYDEVRDDNDCWGCQTPAPSNIYTTAHWIVSESWDYFKNVHNRIGWDDNGGRIRVLSNSKSNNSAYWQGNGLGLGWLEFGETAAGLEMATIDIGGHEYTHGLSRHTANLGNSGQPGALKESFCDIFGCLVEDYSLGGNSNWLIGEDHTPGGLRDVQDPSAVVNPTSGTGSPNVFMGARWFTGSADNGGIHINCGPQNRWFYLLSSGGTENETGITVQGIGLGAAAEIIYYSLTHFIQSGSLYSDARQGAISAARLLYGLCSFEEIQTTNAWAAVGVGPLFAGNCVEISGPFDFCAEPEGLPVVFKAEAPSSSFITWNVPSNWIYTLSGIGNRVLTLTAIVPPPIVSTMVTISISSSDGGSDSQSVLVWADCDEFAPPCPQDGVQALMNNGSSTILVSGYNHLTVYPNPASDFLNIVTKEGTNSFKVGIFDIMGRKVLEKSISGSSTQLSVEALSKGLYYLKVFGNGFQETISFLKK